MLSTKIHVNEIFTSIQGEGTCTGTPSTFIRLVGCNLRCVFKGGSICDSAYTSHNPEPPNFQTVKEVVEEIKKQHQGKKVNHFVITGGEPMRQQDGLQSLINEIRLQFGKKTVITIETNGTIPIREENKDLVNLVDLWSISPKLSTSAYFEGSLVPEIHRIKHNQKRINYQAITDYFGKEGKVQFKFVYSDLSNVEEIQQWFKGLVNFSRIPEELLYSKLYVMPEGETVEQISQKSQELAQICLENGWLFTDRLHIRIWGDKRAV